MPAYDTTFVKMFHIDFSSLGTGCEADGLDDGVKSPQFKLMATVITIGNERPGQGLSGL